MNQTGSRNNRQQIPSSYDGAKGGQVPVRHTTEGDRGTAPYTARGHVSPLGGVSNRLTGDHSKVEENRQQPTKGYGASNEKGMAG